uniref:Uncharacterized protein n=1 Tax=Scaphoideus titanus-associated partiti-like virus 1 TaxID=2716560 RepID=A0A6G7NRM9_9VIRU|nr:hypothetical protein [Scaphoideus titanus-associated partiti-like virus 1]
MAEAVHPAAAAVDSVPGTSGVKRKAGSDLTEPADKKSKVVVRQTEPDILPQSQPGGILKLLANHFGSPFPIADTHFVVINTADVSWYGTIWDTLLSAIYPDGNFVAANVITRNNFILVCRYLTKARIDHVYATCSGRRATGRIPIPREYEIPKCLADVINGIGAITILSGSFMVIPQSETAPPDPTQALGAVVTFDMLSAFSRLVKAGTSRNLIRGAFISSVPEGTAWWLLSARAPANLATIANNVDAATVIAVFKEWTPADGILCALVQRQNDGLFADEVELPMWSFDTVRGISGLRNTFNLDA